MPLVPSLNARRSLFRPSQDELAHASAQRGTGPPLKTSSAMTDTQAVIRLAQQARQLQGLQRGQYVQNVVQSNVIDPRTKAAVMRLYGKFSPHPDMVAQTLNPTSRK